MKRGLKDCVRGLGELVQRDIPRKSICLVTGTPGSLKTSFVYTLMANYLRDSDDELGLYLSLEQEAEQIVKGMENLGVEKPENMEVVDLRLVRERYREIEERVEILPIIQEILESFGERGKLSLFSLDSWNAASAFAAEGVRRASYHFFNALREMGLTSFIVLEIPSMTSVQEYTPEYFLADCIFELGVLEKKEDVVRYFQIRKLRGSGHSMKKHRISVERGGLAILGPVYI